MEKYNFDILQKEKIIIRRFIGKVSSNIILESWSDLLQKEELINQHFNIITDYQQARISFDADKIAQIANEYKKLLKISPKIFHAAVVNSEDDTVFGYLIENEIDNYKTFSTIQAAFGWLSLK
jgi:hypothetical protein